MAQSVYYQKSGEAVLCCKKTARKYGYTASRPSTLNPARDLALISAAQTNAMREARKDSVPFSMLNERYV